MLPANFAESLGLLTRTDRIVPDVAARQGQKHRFQAWHFDRQGPDTGTIFGQKAFRKGVIRGQYNFCFVFSFQPRGIACGDLGMVGVGLGHDAQKLLAKLAF